MTDTDAQPVTDEQYQQFLDIYDDTHDDLLWDQGNGHYIVRGGTESVSPYATEYRDADEDTHRVWMDEAGQLVVNGDIIGEDMSVLLHEAGLSDDTIEACWERLNQANR